MLLLQQQRCPCPPIAHRDIWLQRKARSPSVKLGPWFAWRVTLVSSDQRFSDPIKLPGRKPLAPSMTGRGRCSYRSECSSWTHRGMTSVETTCRAIQNFVYMVDDRVQAG
jgi:hypothetical protein